MHVCALMRAYRGMWSFLSLFVFTLSLQKLPRHTSGNLVKQWNTVKGISLLNCGTDAFVLLQKGIGHGCSFRMTYSILHKWIGAIINSPYIYHCFSTMSLCYQRGLRYVLQIHLHSCMWLVLPPGGRYAAANDKVWERQSEGKRWMWMICGIMLLRGFNVTSGPSICLSCRWQQ